MKFDEAKHASMGFGAEPYFQRIHSQSLRILAKIVVITVAFALIGWLGAQVINWLVDLSE
jgi:hypothetical protein